MERDSSDEEDDGQHLIHQNDTKPISQNRRRSSLDIEDLDSRAPRKRRPMAKIKRGHLLAVLVALSVVVVVLLFKEHVFGSNERDSTGELMRESELRALFLLRQQRSELRTLWDSALSGSDTFHNASSLSVGNSSAGFSKHVEYGPFFEDVKASIARQMKLNRDIQEVLLLPHKPGNSSVEASGGDKDDVNFGINSYDRCRKVDQNVADRKTIEWEPKPDKYLLAICTSGQMSNHLICLEKHMFFAAVLGRTLVIPSASVDYQFDRVLDIDSINQCVGRKVVVPFKEFAEIKKNHLRIDRFICYFSMPQPCFMDDEHVKKLKDLGISMGKPESPWDEDVKEPKKRTIQDVKAKFTADDNVIAIGDVFFADVEKDWVMQSGGPIAHKCKTLIEPNRLIRLTAQRFVQTFLGKDFIALHFRRHGFLKFCNAKKPSCFYPIPQAADCIKRVVERAHAPVIYLSTDAAESETGLLQMLTFIDGKTVPLVKRPERNSAEKWDALLYRHGLDGDSQVDAMLDKTICALSSVFIGTSSSTFTEDILRLRKDWGSASLCDEYLCQGEESNFIAEGE
ncbi:hypothetical protein MLD38_004780 [Melastoma candidum]|uniref:Uncharacterized protein n=1 Tax=Melastoma candidum TaxID=119954 RepID=A0ACB9S8B7_9MYRT|nr:hypothetical protein MLD38_004780 [Melastoma candidum]